MVYLYTYIYRKHQPFMSVNTPFPWMVWGPVNYGDYMFFHMNYESGGQGSTAHLKELSVFFFRIAESPCYFNPKNHEGLSNKDRFDSVEIAGFGIRSPNHQ